jgi:hypothetical protein
MIGGVGPWSDSGSENHLDACRVAGPDACRSVVIVGEDNPLSADPRYALYHEPAGCAGHRLQSSILGLLPRRSYLPIWRTNLCVGGWRPDMAADRAKMLSRPDSPWTLVIMLGVRVADAFSEVTHVSVAPLTASGAFGGSSIRFVNLPHPSGRNLAWNDRRKISAARTLLSRLCPGFRGESSTALVLGAPERRRSARSPGDRDNA